jgi:hypothetical protein
MTGNLAAARADAALTLKGSPNEGTLTNAGIAAALAGDKRVAESSRDALNKRFSSHTVVHEIFEPQVRACLALNQHNPTAAIEALQSASRYEGGNYTLSVYLRGLAFLQSHKGPEAGAEFQKFIGRRWTCLSSGVCSLARLQLARAKMMAGDAPGARTAYQDFFALWKDADPDIPILKEAKAEYAKLQ